MGQGQHSQVDGDERYSTLLNNSNAVRAVTSAVEGTLGPKGLDVMLVGPRGEVVITNDGVTILDKMDVSHPAARLLIQVARAQQEKIGDGTTTATVVAGALVQEGVSRITRGVPASKVVEGMRQGIGLALKLLSEQVRVIDGLSDPLLERTVYVAGRERKDIVELIMKAAEMAGIHTLKDPAYSLADHIVALENAENEVFEGVLLRQKPLFTRESQMHEDAKVLVLMDALEPDEIDEEALTTEAGFAQYMDHRRVFALNMKRLADLSVKLILLEKGIHPDAEQLCLDYGIMVVPRVSRADLRRVCAITDATPVRRKALHKEADQLAAVLGYTPKVSFDETIGKVRLACGDKDRIVTVIVGASTSEVVGEAARIAGDAASALQAAVLGGVLPGGGTSELAISYELERIREAQKGMEAFGIEAVSAALRKPMSQILLNAGYNPLEKMEEVRAAQIHAGSDSKGIDCDTGSIVDYEELGVLDPAPVKLHGLRAAGEVASAILRIHHVIKMKELEEE
ncbi:TCP-1/cpn60 chaperonin family protein [Paenibacillus sp. JCM 10914]|uniref:TCP-1/cpn60 chaperonin family protein n=1 Tax=Paenibacillus sp. JCM 10914 TaxID=1236974 RepID=UPI0003CC2E6C|nr:TCP-1/cpn60 chaperonin family protein [Paenibacillus sp. JCM 10914]GAE04169.1 thermosome subunit [Paenibacillus sp. JCM 10914]